MRKLFVLVLLALTMAWAIPAALAEEGDADKKFVVTGDLDLRWDRLANYFDFDNDSDDEYSFFPYKARVGVSGELANDVTATLEIQNFGSWGNQHPSQDFGFPPFQNFDGDGNINAFRQSETSIYQAMVTLNKIGGSGASVTLGRQQYEFGDGLIVGNEDYYHGTVFDGVKGMYDFEDWSIAAWYFLLSERNDIANFSFSGFASDDQFMYGIVPSFHFGETAKSHVDAYLIDWQDNDEDNGRPQWWTLGGHWWRSVMSKSDADDFAFDWDIEIAFQSGDAEDTSVSPKEKFDLSGNIINGSFGYNLAAGEHMHRFHGGLLRQSGDDDVSDNDLDGWAAIFPRTHNRFGYVDWFGANFGGPLSFIPSGITAYHVGYGLSCRESKHVLEAKYWWFTPTEDKIKDSSGDNNKVEDFGTELDLLYSYQYSKHLTLSLGVGYLWPDEGLTGEDFDSSLPDDAVSRVGGGARLRF